MIMNLFTKSFLIDIQDIQSIKNSELITFNETVLISGQDYHPLDKVIDFLKVIKEKRVGSFFFHGFIFYFYELHLRRYKQLNNR